MERLACTQAKGIGKGFVNKDSIRTLQRADTFLTLPTETVDNFV